MSSIGSLEELILLIVASHGQGAYGVSIAQEYNKRLKKNISVPAVHTALRRLEGKGYLKSAHGGVTKERGGRRKRIYSITPLGFEILDELKLARQSLYLLINEVS